MCPIQSAFSQQLGNSLVYVTSAHTVPQPALSCYTGSLSLDLPSEAQWPQLPMLTDLWLVSLWSSVGPVVCDWHWMWWPRQVTLGPAVGCLDNMLLLLDSTGSIIDFNF